MIRALLLIGILLSAPAVWGQTPIAVLQPADTGPLGGFGESLAVSGSVMLVGDGGGSPEGFQAAGAVYLFEQRDGVWRELGQLRPLDRSPGDSFGRSVALDGNTAIVGAPDNNARGVPPHGAAYLFERIDGIWRQVQQLFPDFDAQDEGFGASVAVSGGLAAVSTERGILYVYQQQTDGTWLQRVRTVYPGWGRSNVSVVGTSVLTAFWGQGIVVLDRGSGLWTQTGFLEVPLLCGAASGNLAVGAGQARASLYERQGTNWVKRQDLVPPDGMQFGFGCAISPDRVLLLAGDGVAVYRRGVAGWSFDGMLYSEFRTAPGVDGKPVAFAGGTMLVGVNQENRVYLFGGTSTAVEELPQALGLLEAWPNPFAERASVRLIPSRSGVVAGRVIDALGREILSLAPKSGVAGEPILWHVDGLQAGLWFVVLHGPDGYQTVPILKTR